MKQGKHESFVFRFLGQGPNVFYSRFLSLHTEIIRIARDQMADAVRTIKLCIPLGVRSDCKSGSRARKKATPSYMQFKIFKSMWYRFCDCDSIVMYLMARCVLY